MSNQITVEVCQVIGDFENCLNELGNTSYSAPSAQLSGGTVGQHSRHVIELFTCLLDGYKIGYVNYEKRDRNLVLQTDVHAALLALQAVRNSIALPDKALKLELGLDAELCIDTNYFRELIYNLEHTIHHMALIRVGIQELTSINLPAHFGVAPGTMKHRETVCAP